MRGHKDALIASLAGFVLTSLAMAPPILSARAEKAARIAAYDRELSLRTTNFGSDRAARLASLLRDGEYREEAQQQLAKQADPNSYTALYSSK